jgi:hypothetical protein
VWTFSHWSPQAEIEILEHFRPALLLGGHGDAETLARILKKQHDFS